MSSSFILMEADRKGHLNTPTTSTTLPQTVITSVPLVPKSHLLSQRQNFMNCAFMLWQCFLIFLLPSAPSQPVSIYPLEACSYETSFINHYCWMVMASSC